MMTTKAKGLSKPVLAYPQRGMASTRDDRAESMNRQSLSLPSARGVEGHANRTNGSPSAAKGQTAGCCVRVFTTPTANSDINEASSSATPTIRLAGINPGRAQRGERDINVGNQSASPILRIEAWEGLFHPFNAGGSRDDESRTRCVAPHYSKPGLSQSRQAGVVLPAEDFIPVC